MTLPRSWTSAWLLGLAFAGWLTAAPRVQAEEKVRVTVLAILATDKNDKVDQQVLCIAQKVQKIEPKLTGFRLGGRQISRSLVIGKQEKFTLVEDVAVQITVDQGADAKNRVQLTVKPPELGEISYASCCGKYFPIITRYQTKDKERLIIAIMVEPCKR